MDSITARIGKRRLNGIEMAMPESYWHRDGHARVALALRWPYQSRIGVEMAMPESHRHRDGHARLA